MEFDAVETVLWLIERVYVLTHQVFFYLFNYPSFLQETIQVKLAVWLWLQYRINSDYALVAGNHLVFTVQYGS